MSAPSKTAEPHVRETGLAAVGKVPWGTHFCVFYETKRDLLDILVPYFEAGLTNNEYCLWVVAPYEFLSAAQAMEALNRAFPEARRYSEIGKLEIVAHAKWFGANGRIDISKGINRFRKRLTDAEQHGLTGLRVNGSSAWVRENCHARRFRDFEHELDTMIANRRMVVACTFPLTLSRADDILDAARTHQFAVTVRKGLWKRIEIANIARARSEAEETSPRLAQLTFRQREILQRIAEGQNTKEIAALLGISAKTVEAHRLQLMRRLKIDNVAGLVRFAIRHGLVSAEI